MADLIGAFFRELIGMILQGVVEGAVKLFGWLNLLILVAVVAVGAAAFYFAMPGLLT